MEPLLLRGGQQPVAHDVLAAVVGQLQVVDARVHAGEAAVAGVHLFDDGEPGVEVGQPARRQRGAAGGELQEPLPLRAGQLLQDTDEPQEARAAERRRRRRAGQPTTAPWSSVTGSGLIHLFPAKYRQSARISVIVHRIRQYGIEHLLLDTAHEVRYSAA